MKLETIENMWAEDSVINPTLLDEASLDTAKLHSKYLRLFNEARMKYKLKDTTLKTLKHNKWRYYTGKMTKQEMDQYEWPYDPYNGCTKPMKSEISQYIENDKDVIELALKVEYLNVLVLTLEEIISNIRWRHSNIRNIIDFRKFQAGF